MRSHNIVNEQLKDEAPFGDIGKLSGLNDATETPTVRLELDRSKYRGLEKGAAVIYKWNGYQWIATERENVNKAFKDLRAFRPPVPANKLIRGPITNMWRRANGLSEIIFTEKGLIRIDPQTGNPVIGKTATPFTVGRLTSKPSPDMVGAMPNWKDVVDDLPPKKPTPPSAARRTGTGTPYDTSNRPVAHRPSSMFHTSGNRVEPVAPLRAGHGRNPAQGDLFNNPLQRPAGPAGFRMGVSSNSSTKKLPKINPAAPLKNIKLHIAQLIDALAGTAGYLKLRGDIHLYYQGKFVPVDMKDFVPPCKRIGPGAYDVASDPIIDPFRTNDKRIRFEYRDVDFFRQLANKAEDDPEVFGGQWFGGTVKNPLQVIELSKQYARSTAVDTYSFGTRAERVHIDMLRGGLTAAVAVTVMSITAAIVAALSITVVGIVPSLILLCINVGLTWAITSLIDYVLRKNEWLIYPLGKLLAQSFVDEVTDQDFINQVCNRRSIGDFIQPHADRAKDILSALSDQAKTTLDTISPASLDESLSLTDNKEITQADLLRSMSPRDIKSLNEGLIGAMKEIEDKAKTNPKWQKQLEEIKKEAERIGSPGFGVAKDVAAGRSAIAQNVLDTDTAPEFNPAEIGDKL